jgi:23S rRNA (guanosine2251-2'-O)-methyltransferase
MRKLQVEELNRISPDSYQSKASDNLVIVLDNVRSMHNVGSTFRTADGFGVKKICLCGITATPPHREIEKTALGATETVAWEHYPQTIDALTLLRQEGYQIVAVEQTTQSVLLQNFVFEPTQKYALVFGNEVFGVTDEALKYCEKSIEIPQVGSKHSLNISVCVGILVWQYTMSTQQ